MKSWEKSRTSSSVTHNKNSRTIEFYSNKLIWNNIFIVPINVFCESFCCRSWNEKANLKLSYMHLLTRASFMLIHNFRFRSCRSDTVINELSACVCFIWQPASNGVNRPETKECFLLLVNPIGLIHIVSCEQILVIRISN